MNSGATEAEIQASMFPGHDAENNRGSHSSFPVSIWIAQVQS